jgi:hypothetical protein
MSAGEQQPPDWNPYQQAGYHQDNPYQQSTVPMGQAQAPTGGMPPQGPDADKPHKTKMTLAIIAAVAMVVGTTVGGVLLTGGDGKSDDPVVAKPADGGGDEEKDPEEDEDPDAEGDPDEGDPDEGDPDEGEDEDEKPSDPRGGTKPKVDPVVAEDWQVQALPDRDIAYDVPPEWEVDTPTTQYLWEIHIDGEEPEEGENTPMLSIKAPASSPLNECGYAPVSVGTTGELGAANTEKAAENSAFQYVLGVYDNNQKGTRKDVPAEAFSNDHGFAGHIASATVEGFPLGATAEEKDEPCHPPGGKVVVVSYVTPTGDIASFLIISDTGVDGEIDQDTIDKMLGSLRSYEENKH